MKKLIFIVCLAFCICKVNGQTSTVVIRPVATDSNKKTPVVKGVKTRIIDGIQMSSAYDAVENLSRSKAHTMLMKAILISGLSETLKSKGPLTIFAPTDNAFKKLNSNALDTLLKPSNNEELTKLVSYYIVPGKLKSKEITKQIINNKGEATFITLSGAKLKAKINADRNIILIDENGNESIVSQFDIEQNNGIINIITGLLTPKSK